jgi:hypothetical protein
MRHMRHGAAARFPSVRRPLTRRILALTLVALTLSAEPAVAISAAVAKKCRELAVKAHPPQPAGKAAYAQAERDFFRDCVAKEEKPK